MIDQRSPEWFQARLGKVTSSRLADVLATRRDGKPAASRENYLAELVAERLTGVHYEGYTNDAMLWGTEQEPYARGAYEAITGFSVDLVGFVDHPTIRDAGASPDGLVGDDGLVEIKCPNTATHIGSLRGAGIGGDYIAQMRWQMACTGRAWCDFVSFDPRLPDKLQLHVRRVTRDDTWIAAAEDAVMAFLAEIEQVIVELGRPRC